METIFGSPVPQWYKNATTEGKVYFEDATEYLYYGMTKASYLQHENHSNTELANEAWHQAFLFMSSID